MAEQSFIELNIQQVQQRLAGACRRAGRRPEDVLLVAVTKGVAASTIQAAFGAGLRHFGENRVQDAETKIAGLSELPVTWHMVGHLQTNKVKTALELFHMIHSVDSLHLAEALSRRAQREIPVLLQVNVSAEGTKQGFSPQELPKAVENIVKLPYLVVRGLMTVAPLAENPEQVRPVFARLRQLRDSLGLEHLSMGMTDDFEVAVEEGATIVRIGRAIFGPRPTNSGVIN